jgi:type IV pilus assembly protein PilV
MVFSANYQGRPKQQNGFSLIEVLVSGALMSSGMAGLAVLLFTSVSGTSQTVHQTSASLLADGAVAMIEMSPHNRHLFLQPPPPVVIECNQSNPCTAEQFALANLGAWKTTVTGRLPGGQGVICLDSSPFDGAIDQPECDGDSLIVIKIFWKQGQQLSPSPSRIVKIPG